MYLPTCVMPISILLISLIVYHVYLEFIMLYVDHAYICPQNVMLC